MSPSAIIAVMASWIVSVISAGGYWGILLLMAIESACLPLPSEVIMPFGGYLAYKGELDLFWVATAGAVGCNLGSIPAYWLGARGGRRAIAKYGKYVLLSERDLEWSERFFNRLGGLAVFVCRLLPVVRSFIALPAGMARMPLVPFHVYTFLGSWPWCYALAWVGFKLGAKWDSDPRVKAVFHQADAVIVVVIVLAVGWFVRTRIKGPQAAI